MLIALIIFFLLLSALFSGTEIAFISASKLKLELRKKKGARKGAILGRFYDKPADFLGSLLVGNNIALVVFTYLMTKILNPFFENSISNEALLLVVNTLLITVVVLIFGEFFPKIFFRLYADRVLYFFTYPLLILKWLLQIPSWLVTGISGFLLKYLLKASDDRVENVFTRLELENFVRDSAAKSEDEIDTDLFGRALYLKNIKVKECMVPRPEIVHIDVNADVEELRQLFMDSKLSRIIVVDGDIDNVLGYIHHQQLLNKPKAINKIYMEIPIFPEVMKVKDLMNRFIKDRVKIACVVDEYGGTAGIVTMEDVLEEIFGEIEDEHDQEEHIEMQIGENEYLFSGRLEIDYLNEKYEQLAIPEGEYHTLSGYLVMTSGEIPEQGAEMIQDGSKFILELVSDTRIETVRVIKLKEKDEEAA